jgi:hypothetical protein
MRQAFAEGERTETHWIDMILALINGNGSRSELSSCGSLRGFTFALILLEIALIGYE